LYEGARKVALKDISFLAIDIYKNVFNKIKGNYPYVLTLKSKLNCFTFYYGTAVKGQIELFLPSEAYALETYDWLYKTAQGLNSSTHAETDTLSETNAKDICRSTLIFLNDIMTNNLVDYMDGLLYTNGYNEDLFYSKNAFPNAIKTYIIDTSMFQEYYRNAEIIFMEEYPDDNNISTSMLYKYKELVSLMKLCLANNKFEYINKDASQGDLYEYQSDFTKLQAPDPNVLFSSLQTQRGYIVRVVIAQNNKSDGSYINTLEMKLYAQ